MGAVPRPQTRMSYSGEPSASVAQLKTIGGMARSKPTTGSKASTTTRCRSRNMARFFHILAIRPLLPTCLLINTGRVIQRGVEIEASAPAGSRRWRLHWAWMIAAVAFLTLIAAAAFGTVPGVLIDPLHDEFGWSRGTIGSAVSVNLILFGVISPFAAALMDRLGVRRVVAGALVLVAAGAGLTVFMTEPWQLLMCWGVLVGVGTGSMSMPFVAVITGRWFVKRRGLVSGVLTAAGATGQLIFLPLLAALATEHGWRVPS